MGKRGYTYSPLEAANGLRLLTIDAVGENRGELRCTMKHFSFDTAPPYGALSYEWGNTGFKKRLILNNKHFDVGENLRNALWYLATMEFFISSDVRGPRNTNHRLTWLWVDALCIDQRNTAERNHQVRLMGDIYKNAIEVFVWLAQELPVTLE
jgi:hypothetical protein